MTQEVDNIGGSNTEPVCPGFRLRVTLPPAEVLTNYLSRRFRAEFNLRRIQPIPEPTSPSVPDPDDVRLFDTIGDYPLGYLSPPQHRPQHFIITNTKKTASGTG